MSVEKPKVSYSIQEAAEATGYGHLVIREAIKARRLIAHWPTAKATILAEDLKAWVEDSPTERSAS